MFFKVRNVMHLAGAHVSRLSLDGFQWQWSESAFKGPINPKSIIFFGINSESESASGRDAGSLTDVTETV